MRSTRWLAVALMFGMGVSAARGSALVTKGSSEIALEGKLDFATEMGADFDLRAKYAYFLLDRFSMGFRTMAGDNDAVGYFGVGLTAEYNFALSPNYKPIIGTDMVPFLGAFVDYRHADLFEVKEDAGVFGGEVGLKFFLTDSTAITLALVGELATEEIYADDLEATDKDLSLQLGMRFYF